jgi:16S rRNA A1518/A1519 N6-dimethyltransferase RsmA/KsgA/DIM1 with predicted DNA glycosylase/AP lyase activity
MQRRKMVLKLLKQDWPEQKLKQLFQQLCISPQERAEILAWNNLFCSHII